MATEETVDPLSAFNDLEKADLVLVARLIESTERFEDMCKIMGILVQKKGKEGLVVEERNMLSVAYKNVVGQRRASWRNLKAEDEMNDDGSSDRLKKYRADYKTVLEQELTEKCMEVLNLLKDNLIDPKFCEDAKNQATSGTEENMSEEESKEAKDKVETQVFYLKMSGDYYRYLAEFSDKQEHKTKAGEQYNKALELAKAKLQPTHPTRLGLALNASVCYYEIMKKPDQACKLAKDAFDEAIQKLDSLSDSTYKDSTLIMQLLRDNLTIWTSENDNGPTIEKNED